MKPRRIVSRDWRECPRCRYAMVPLDDYLRAKPDEDLAFSQRDWQSERRGLARGQVALGLMLWDLLRYGWAAVDRWLRLRKRRRLEALRTPSALVCPNCFHAQR
jgi:hypothetical protein